MTTHQPSIQSALGQIWGPISDRSPFKRLFRGQADVVEKECEGRHTHKRTHHYPVFLLDAFARPSICP